MYTEFRIGPTQELKDNGGQLGKHGHSMQNRVKLQVSDPSQAHQVDPQEFKDSYDKHSVLKDTGSPMYKALKNKELQSIDDIRKYAIDNPETRSAEVYDSIRYGK